MRTDLIRQQIASAFAEERVSGRFVQLVRTFAQQRNVQPTQADLETFIAFVRQYMDAVPSLLDETAAASRRAGIGATVLPMLEAAAQYWHEPNDLIPDSLGVVGLLDDAYYSMSLMQSLSINQQQRTGTPLLTQDYSEANRIIRNVIGEPLASILDTTVASVQRQPTFLDAFAQLARFQAPPLPVRDPVWGNASIDQIVKVKMGAMGIF
jgi:uncharacterized membrane protein YkvA (DUF1232 family)